MHSTGSLNINAGHDKVDMAESEDKLRKGGRAEMSMFRRFLKSLFGDNDEVNYSVSSATSLCSKWRHFDSVGVRVILGNTSSMIYIYAEFAVTCR